MIDTGPEFDQADSSRGRIELIAARLDQADQGEACPGQGETRPCPVKASLRGPIRARLARAGAVCGIFWILFRLLGRLMLVAAGVGALVFLLDMELPVGVEVAVRDHGPQESYCFCAAAGSTRRR